MNKEKISPKPINYIDIDYPETLIITDETRRITMAAAGVGYTNEEFEQLRKKVDKDEKKLFKKLDAVGRGVISTELRSPYYEKTSKNK